MSFRAESPVLNVWELLKNTPNGAFTWSLNISKSGFQKVCLVPNWNHQQNDFKCFVSVNTFKLGGSWVRPWPTGTRPASGE